MKVLLAHHWLISQRGGENVFAEICREFADGEIYTLIKTSDLHILDTVFSNRRISTSFLKWIPKAEKIYKNLLPFYPMAISLMHVPKDVELLISSDASMIKGIRRLKRTKHICYCHSPPRYLWDLSSEYMESFGKIRQFFFKFFLKWLQKFDLKAANNVDFFIANSYYVKERIRRIYNREAKVIYPFVSLNSYSISNKDDGFYLIVSALVPYKRIDIAVRAFCKLNEKLIVIGSGSELDRLRKIATGNIVFMDRQPQEILVKFYQTCKALIFPGVEDFGITPLEAQACGKPVIAYGQGGVLETVIEGKTGVFFFENTPESLINAIQRFQLISFDPILCRENAERFSAKVFKEELRKFVYSKVKV